MSCLVLSCLVFFCVVLCVLCLPADHTLFFRVPSWFLERAGRESNVWKAWFADMVVLRIWIGFGLMYLERPAFASFEGWFGFD